MFSAARRQRKFEKLIATYLQLATSVSSVGNADDLKRPRPGELLSLMRVMRYWNNTAFQWELSGWLNLRSAYRKESLHISEEVASCSQVACDESPLVAACREVGRCQVDLRVLIDTLLCGQPITEQELATICHELKKAEGALFTLLGDDSEYILTTWYWSTWSSYDDQDNYPWPFDGPSELLITCLMIFFYQEYTTQASR